MPHRQPPDWELQWISSFQEGERKTEEIWRQTPVFLGAEQFDTEFEIATYMNLRWGINPTRDGDRYYVIGSKEVVDILSTFFKETGLVSLEEMSNYGIDLSALRSVFQNFIDDWIKNKKYDYEIENIDDYLQRIIFRKVVILQRKSGDRYEIVVRY